VTGIDDEDTGKPLRSVQTRLVISGGASGHVLPPGTERPQ